MNKTLWRVTLLAGLLVSGLLACTRAPAADSERVALEAAIHRWIAAVNAQDVATLTTTMTEDVELLEDAATVSGRDAAIRALRKVVARGPLTATSREITIDNDIAWHVAGLAQTQKNGDVHALGQALEIWKRVKGEWKLHRRMAAGVGTPEVLLTRPSTNEPVLDRPKNQSD
jgi:ketosteroid isomerase-like protein